MLLPFESCKDLNDIDTDFLLNYVRRGGSMLLFPNLSKSGSWMGLSMVDSHKSGHHEAPTSKGFFLGPIKPHTEKFQEPINELVQIQSKKPPKGKRELPEQALHTLFEFLDMYSLGVAMLVCRHWFQEGSRECVWATLAANIRFPSYYFDLTNKNEQNFNRKSFLKYLTYSKQSIAVMQLASSNYLVKRGTEIRIEGTKRWNVLHALEEGDPIRFAHCPRFMGKQKGQMLAMCDSSLLVQGDFLGVMKKFVYDASYYTGAS